MDGMGLETAPIYRVNDTGQLSRIWGGQEEMNEKSGFDVERALWKEVIEANCRKTWLEPCLGVTNYFKSVFGDI